jgi:hypothetical protein
MGGTMSAHHSTPAEHTAAILQEASLNGLPVPIPGAFELRPGRPIAQPTGTAPALTPHVRARVESRARLEREREGGGAPSERRVRRHGTILARLWRGMLHPADIPAIWRRPIAEVR